MVTWGDPWLLCQFQIRNTKCNREIYPEPSDLGAYQAEARIIVVTSRPHAGSAGLLMSVTHHREVYLPDLIGAAVTAAPSNSVR